MGRTGSWKLVVLTSEVYQYPADTDHGSSQLTCLHKEIDKIKVGGGRQGEEG